MKTEYYITIKDFCVGHRIEESFVLSLSERELISIAVLDDEAKIHTKELPKLERIVRLHHELGVNIEGIEAIQHLLEKVDRLQDELWSLRRRLSRFEEDPF
ncbi:chaperone modulator CbpM [Sungkyunkwania multivorans]|uniref:Chaperone modulator CbpM n=1 Tax=Sungkyunkwania multivorans TaxID=1173618 RepID=A0ABW3D5C8_9FLAO